jgi:ribosomal protein S14
LKDRLASRYARQIPIDVDLADAAKRAEGRLIESEREAERARADFHGAIRRLHLSGASLREIASTLGLSHQRVHQIVEGAGGSRRWRKRKETGEHRACSFCGRPQRKARPLVAGPGVYICESCVGISREVLLTSKPAETPLATIVAVSADNPRERCSFCGRRRHQIGGLASTGDVLICTDCLKLCHEILAEQLG